VEAGVLNQRSARIAATMALVVPENRPDAQRRRKTPQGWKQFSVIPAVAFGDVAQ
jgi:hypothetical protein